MRRLLLLIAPVAILGGLLATSSIGPASASTKAPLVTGSFTDKPYTATTPDSGSAGNNWALDLFTRDFVVFPKTSAGTKVVEHFNNGRFITLGDGATGSAASPGAGDSSGNSTHMLREGVSGTFFGTFTIMVDPTYSYVSGGACNSAEGGPGASTDDGCTTASWIALAFPGATYGLNANVTAYSLTYKATGTGLIGSKWTDSSAGDSGDIYTAAS